jgi:hypothetical protein
LVVKRLSGREWIGADDDGQRFDGNPFRQLPEEQSPADALSLTFDSEPLAESLEILGIPVARIRVRSSQPVAKLVARLTEVTPDGQSWLVAYGVLNLTHREGSGRPKPLPVGQDVDVAIPLEFRGYRFKPGHRIRLALSETLWPLLWPSPRQAVLQITTGASWLELPVRPLGIDDPPMPIPLLTDVNLPPANPPPPAPLPPGLEGPTFLVETAGPDPDGLVRVTITRRRPIRLAGTGTDLQANQNWVLEIRESDPNSSVWQGAVSFLFRRGDWDAEVRSAFRLDGTPDTLRLTEAITAFEGDRRVFRRRWRRRVARELL